MALPGPVGCRLPAARQHRGDGWVCPESQEPPPASGQVECGPREHVGCAHRGHGCTPPERQPHRGPRRDVGRPGGRENESSRIHHDSTWWRPPLGRLRRVSRARPRWREGADPRVPPTVTVAFGMDPPGAWEQGSEGSRPPGGCSLSGLSWASGTALPGPRRAFSRGGAGRRLWLRGGFADASFLSSPARPFGRGIQGCLSDTLRKVQTI